MRAECYKYQGKGTIPDFLKTNLTIPEDPSSEDDTWIISIQSSFTDWISLTAPMQRRNGLSYLWSDLQWTSKGWRTLEIERFQPAHGGGQTAACNSSRNQMLALVERWWNSDRWDQRPSVLSITQRRQERGTRAGDSSKTRTLIAASRTG